MVEYHLRWSIFGGWQAYSGNELLRLGAGYGEVPRRFKTEAAAHNAVARYYRAIKRQRSRNEP